VAVVTAASVIALVAPTAASAAANGSEATYLVVYKGGASTTDAKATVESAGGVLVANYSAIGVVVARSSNAGFAATVKKNNKVEGAAATAGLGTRITDDTVTAPTPAPAAATWGDSLSGLQWDMRQINVPAAHGISEGSPTIHVADIDTGLDFTLPDLAPNYAAANSTNCITGAPQPLLPGNDGNGHGTHTAGTIAAAANGTGIVGVAPHVKIAGVKAGTDVGGFFFPEAVICAYMWVATHNIDLTNNSYFADPWLFNCKNDPEQRAIWNAERRAIRYAQSQGTTVIASEGNDSTDLSHPTVDTVSPDFPPGSEQVRQITNACAVVPVEVPGVVGVTAMGNLRLKSFYSSYGISTADVAAPGGDSVLQVTAAAPNGRVLSTWPAAFADACLRRVQDPTTGAWYCYLQGTSMAAPHAVGVAALLKSVRGGTAGSVAAKLQQATNPIACPSADVLALYAQFPQLSGAPQSCSGGPAHNSWYGSGEVDALKAVS
jgi:subtilisin family serine protease